MEMKSALLKYIAIEGLKHPRPMLSAIIDTLSGKIQEKKQETKKKIITFFS